MNRTMNFLITTLFTLTAITAFAKGRIQNEDVKSLSDITSSVLTTTGNISSVSACITSPGSVTGLAVGLFVYDTTTPANINSGVTIAGLPGSCAAGQIQMSANAAGTATGDTLTFGGQASQLINDSKLYVSAQSINDTLANAISNGRIGGSGGAGGINTLSTLNWDFEAGAGNWTASGGTFTSSATSPLFGLKSGNWTPSGAQTLKSALVTTPNGLVGENCSASAWVSWSGTQGVLKFEATDGTTTLATLDVPSSSSPQKVILFFTCTSTIQAQLRATGSSSLALIDNVILGQDAMLSVQTTEIYAQVSYGQVASCDVTTTSGSTAEVADQAACTNRSSLGQGSFVNHQFKMGLNNGMPAGRYELITQAPVYVSGGAGTTCELYMSGTNVGNFPGGYFAFDQPGTTSLGNPLQGNNVLVWDQPTAISGTSDFHMNWRRTGGAGTCHIGTSAMGGNQGFSMILKRYPLVASDAVNLATQPAFAVAKSIGVAQTTTTSTTLSTVSAASYASSRTFSGLGSVCTTANDYCVKVASLPAGTYLVMASQPLENLGSGFACSSQITDGTNTIAQIGTGNAGLGGAPLQGYITYASPQTNLEFKVQFQTVGGAPTCAVGVNNGGTSTAVISIVPVTQNLPSPVFTAINAKVDSSTVGMRMEAVTVDPNCSASPCTMVRPTAGVTSVTRGSIGAYTINFVSGTFSAAPHCSALAKFSGGAQWAATNGTPTSTTHLVNVLNSAGSLADGGFVATCFGPK